MKQLLLYIGLLIGLTYCQQDDLKSTMMDRQSLHEYSLAKCSDGSPAAYYIEKDLSNAGKKVMIFFENSVDAMMKPIQPCTSVDECLDICESFPEACSSPVDATRLQRDGLWSREKENSPFADYFKIYLPSCSLDDFSGAKGPLTGSNGGKIFFHGRHIFSALLRDLVANYGIDQADSIVLIGSGSGARGVGHGCDYLSDAIATVNANAQVRCVLDGPDLIPYWLNDQVAQDRCDTVGTEAFYEEATKNLWGRTDDESCVRELENFANDSEIASTCGIFSKYWRHVNTPMFIIASQWNKIDFDRTTCNVSLDDPDYEVYRNAWQQGILSLAEALSLDQPDNGWFLPSCIDDTLFFSSLSLEQRQKVKIPLFVSGEPKNVFQVLNNWLVKGTEDDDYQAMDQFGTANPACSNINQERSQPLQKKGSTQQRLVPLDPLDDVPKPKGFPDGPPPKPRDPIDTFGKGFSNSRFQPDSLFSSDRFFSRTALKRFQQPIMNHGKKSDQSDMKLAQQRVSDAEVILGAELFKQYLSGQTEQQRRFPGSSSSSRNDFRDIDFDTLYQLYRSRIWRPFDLLYYRYNLYKQPQRQSGTDAIFDPIDPQTPEFFDYDYDVNVNYGPGGSPLPTGILPEQAVALSNSRSRKARLWRKVYYLQYLRELYRRTYADYYNDYYYGLEKSGNYGRLTKDEEEQSRRN